MKNWHVSSLNSPVQHVFLVTLVAAGIRKRKMWDPRWRKGHFMMKCPISAVESGFLVLIYRKYAGMKL